MFSNNGKISSRQIKRLLIFDLFGAGSLLLPAHLAGSGNGAGIWSILAGTALAGLYLWIILVCCGQAPIDYLGYLKGGWGDFLSKFFYMCYAVICIFSCAWAAKLLTELMCGSLLDSREFPVALFVILALAFYGGIAGLEARARVYEIMFWVLVIPLVIMLLLCIRQVQVMQWFPLTGAADGDGAGWLWSGTWKCFLAFLPLTFLLFLIPHMKNRKKTGQAASWAVAASGAAILIIYLILLGIFGSGALAQEEYPVITLMGMVKIPGDFLKRLDAVMVGVWFFTLYALIGSALYYGVDTAYSVFQKKRRNSAENLNADSKNEQGKKWWFFVTAAAVYGIAYGFHLWPQAEEAVCEIFNFAGVPFLVLVPAGALVLNRMHS